MWYIISVLPWLIIFWMIFPGSFTVTVVILLICLVGIGILYLAARLTDRKTNKVALDREKAIQEWERKWKRPHPTRKTINSFYNANQKR